MKFAVLIAFGCLWNLGWFLLGSAALADTVETNSPSVHRGVRQMPTLVDMAITSTLKTNVLEWDNHKGCELCYQRDQGMPVPPHPSHVGPAFVPADERWEIRSILKITTFRWQWDGRKFIHHSVETISSETNNFTLKAKWEKK